PDPLPPYSFEPGSRDVANIAAAAAGKNFIATWDSPPSGIPEDPLQTTYGLDIRTCPKCGSRPMTHAASPVRETQKSYDLCKTLSGIIAGVRKAKMKTMVGVLV